MRRSDGRGLRVVLVAGGDPGHAFPAAALTRRLQAAGHRPVLLTAARWGEALAADGVDARPLPPFPEPDSDDFGYRLHARAAQMAPVLADTFGDLGPDLVVGDVLAGGAGLAAELTGCPWAELVPHPLHLPSRALPPPGSGLAPGRGPLGAVRDAVLRRASARSLAEGVRQRERARRTLGLDPEQPPPDARLVATLPGLEPPRPDWPARTYVVGPLHWDPTRRDLPPPEGSAPLVLVVASTAAAGRSGVFEAALAGLDGLRMASVRFRPFSGPLPPGVVAGPGRLAPLVAAAAVVVTGGGHGMVSRALQAGRPLVLVPGGGDQRDLAARVARAGAGAVVRPLSPDRLASAVHAVLADPSYPASAGRLGHCGDLPDPVTVCERAAADRKGRARGHPGS